MKARWILGIVVVAMLLGGGGWAYARYFRVDPQVREIETLQARIEEMAPKNGERPDFEKMRPAVEEMRAKIEALPEGQQEQVEDAMRQRFFAHMQQRDQQRMADFFALSKEQRTAALDKDIDMYEARRAEWTQRRVEGEGAAAKGKDQAVDPKVPSGNGNVPGGNGNVPNSKGSVSGGTTAAPAGKGPAPGPGGFPPGRPQDREQFRARMANMTPEQRKEMNRRFLEHSTPEYRAQRTEYVRLMEQRRKERGLPTAPMGPFGFGPPPGVQAPPPVTRTAP